MHAGWYAESVKVLDLVLSVLMEAAINCSWLSCLLFGLLSMGHLYFICPFNTDLVIAHIAVFSFVLKTFVRLSCLFTTLSIFAGCYLILCVDRCVF